MTAAILENAVSDRDTVGGVTQFTISRRFSSRKLLILNGEMSEWLKEHAWKASPSTDADAQQISPTHSPSTTSRYNDVHRTVPINRGI